MRGPTDIQALLSAMAGGTEFRFQYFWGHTPKADGSPSSSCLSQWWPARFVLDGVSYRTAEHYLMAQKAYLFGDTITARSILRTAEPSQAKRLGRGVRGFDEQAWSDARFGVAVRGNSAKFSQNPDLGGYLRSTGADILVEASPVDAIWGIGLARDDPAAACPDRWRGLNLLGFALMVTRDNI